MEKTQIQVTAAFATFIKDLGETYAAPGKSKGRDNVPMTQWEVCAAMQDFFADYQWTPGENQELDCDGNPVFDSDGNPVIETLDAFAPYAKAITDERHGRTRNNTAKRDLEAARENVKRFLIAQGLTGEELETQLCKLCGGGTPA